MASNGIPICGVFKHPTKGGGTLDRVNSQNEVDATGQFLQLPSDTDAPVGTGGITGITNTAGPNTPYTVSPQGVVSMSNPIIGEQSYNPAIHGNQSVQAYSRIRLDPATGYLWSDLPAPQQAFKDFQHNVTQTLDLNTVDQVANSTATAVMSFTNYSHDVMHVRAVTDIEPRFVHGYTDNLAAVVTAKAARSIDQGTWAVDGGGQSSGFDGGYLDHRPEFSIFNTWELGVGETARAQYRLEYTYVSGTGSVLAESVRFKTYWHGSTSWKVIS